MTTRRLAAIMFTDIVGYTAMMQENEQHAATVREHHRKAFHHCHEQFHGEVLQYYGDGTLSIFKSAIEAVECAVAMQRALQEGTPVPLRIGLHVGDIVFSGSEVYGDGVNLASRVESLGVPGAILVSDKVRYEIKNQENIHTKSLGHFEFKNIREPIEVYAISNSGINVPERSELKGKLKQDKKSIAVLPFVNMSADPDNEYFSDGIAEEILNALVKVEGLKVIARTSSFAFKGKNMDVRDIGRQLSVVHILEGSVRKAGNRVRITAQLVSAIDGSHFFSETYDRELQDIFAVQDEIAQKITNRLREHLGEDQHQQQLVKAPTLNMEAYETYLKGVYYFNQWGEAMAKAIPYFIRAIEMQEGFAQAHARLGICYYFSGFGREMSWVEVQEKATFHISKTIELNVEAAEVYFAQFVLHIFIQWDWKSALAITKKGLELFPNFASLHHSLSTLYWINGDLLQAMKAHIQGVELDPLSIELNLYMGVAYLWVEDYASALHYFHKVLELVPNHRPAREYTGWTAAFQGKYKEAIAIFSTLEPTGYLMHRSTCLGWAYHKLGEFEKAKEFAQEMEDLNDKSPGGVGYTVDLATLFTAMENFDKAFYYLEKAIKNRVGSIMMIRKNPFFTPLFPDPRFKKMEDMIGVVPGI